jgi:hypothetical protein
MATGPVRDDTRWARTISRAQAAYGAGPPCLVLTAPRWACPSRTHDAPGRRWPELASEGAWDDH